MENAFRSFNVTGKFPFFVLFIDTYPELIDVNIHPTKSEIKFKDERFIFKLVFDAVHSAMREYVKDTFTLPEEEQKKFEALKEEVIQESLDKEISTLEKLKENINYKVSDDKRKEEIYSHNPSKDYEAKTEVNIPVDFLSKENKEESSKFNNSLNDFKDGSYKIEISYDTILIKNELKDKVSENTHDSLETSDYKCNKNEHGNSLEETIYKEAKFPKLRVIGQFNKTYILAEYDSTLYLIDQHAAHEKILFEKYSSDIAKKKVEIQPLMIPLVVTLPTEDYLYYDENKEIFEKAGFKISDFGDNSIRIEEVPYFLDKLNPTELITSMINNLKKMGTGETVEVKYNKIASMSCRAAVKANDVLSILEMENLIEDLRYINDPFHCPHGRPTIIKFTSYELDKKFKRIT